jgi:hypothetical protein
LDFKPEKNFQFFFGEKRKKKKRGKQNVENKEDMNQSKLPSSMS